VDRRRRPEPNKRRSSVLTDGRQISSGITGIDAVLPIEVKSPHNDVRTSGGLFVIAEGLERPKKGLTFRHGRIRHLPAAGKEGNAREAVSVTYNSWHEAAYSPADGPLGDIFRAEPWA